MFWMITLACRGFPCFRAQINFLILFLARTFLTPAYLVKRGCVPLKLEFRDALTLQIFNSLLTGGGCEVLPEWMTPKRNVIPVVLLNWQGNRLLSTAMVPINWPHSG